MKPHQENNFKALSAGIATSTAISGLFAAAMTYAGMHSEVILPTTAPIFIGTASLIFMAAKD